MIRIWVGEVAGVVRAKVKRPNRVIFLGHWITSEVRDLAKRPHTFASCLFLARDGM
jgi:hypothetical protein